MTAKKIVMEITSSVSLWLSEKNRCSGSYLVITMNGIDVGIEKKHDIKEL
jgi:hypothetical protein